MIPYVTYYLFQINRVQWALAVGSKHAEKKQKKTELNYFTNGQKQNNTIPGPLFTKKTPSYGYRNPHYKHKTVWRPSQVYNGNPYTDKTASSQWIEAQASVWSGLISPWNQATNMSDKFRGRFKHES